MERIAILIESSNVSGQVFLPGALADLNSWNDFLRSNLGGAWPSTHIIHKNKPKSSEIIKLLYEHRDKYCFVVFSGHGYFDSKGNTTRLCLNDSEIDVPESALTPQGVKGTLIIDACRGTESVITGIVEESSQAKLLHEGFSMRTSTTASFSKPILKLDPAVRWLLYLITSKPGKVIMYSCSISQSAGEFAEGEPLQGGYFTTALIHGSKYWSKSASNNTMQSSLDAFEKACEILQAFSKEQVPQYLDRSIYFPFAISN